MAIIMNNCPTPLNAPGIIFSNNPYLIVLRLLAMKKWVNKDYMTPL